MNKPLARLALLFLALLAVVHVPGCAGDPAVTALSDTAEAFYEALGQRRYEQAVQRLAPAKVAVMGGESFAASQLAETMEPLTIKDISITEVQMGQAGGESSLVGVVHTELIADRLNRLNNKTYEIKLTGGLIGLSGDKGKTWRLLGVSALDQGLLTPAQRQALHHMAVPAEKMFVKEGDSWEPLMGG